MRRRWGFLFVVVIFIAGSLIAQDTPPDSTLEPAVPTADVIALDPLPVTVEPSLTETPTISPTSTEINAVVLTQTPVPLTATATNDVIVPPTSDTSVVGTPTLLPEPALAPIFMDAFNQVDTVNWSFGRGWAYHPVNEGQALRVYNSDAPIVWTGTPLADVVVEGYFIVDYGSAFLSVRQSAAGSYTVSLDGAGVVSLWRSGTVAAQAITSPTLVEQWRKVRLSAIGNVVRVAVDDVPLLTYEDATPLPAGQVAIRALFNPLPADYGTPQPPINTLLVDDVIISVPTSMVFPTQVIPTASMTPSLTTTTVSVIAPASVAQDSDQMALLSEPTATPYVASFSIANSQLTPQFILTPATGTPDVYTLNLVAIPGARIIANTVPNSITGGKVLFRVDGNYTGWDFGSPYVWTTPPAVDMTPYILQAQSYEMTAIAPGATPGVPGEIAIRVVNHTMTPTATATPTSTPHIMAYAVANMSLTPLMTVLSNPITGSGTPTPTPLVFNIAAYPSVTAVKLIPYFAPLSKTPSAISYRGTTPVAHITQAWATNAPFVYPRTLVPNTWAYNISAFPYSLPWAAGSVPGLPSKILVQVVNQTLTPTPTATATFTATLTLTPTPTASLIVTPTFMPDEWECTYDFTTGEHGWVRYGHGTVATHDLAGWHAVRKSDWGWKTIMLEKDLRADNQPVHITGITAYHVSHTVQSPFNGVDYNSMGINGGAFGSVIFGETPPSPWIATGNVTNGQSAYFKLLVDQSGWNRPEYHSTLSAIKLRGLGPIKPDECADDATPTPTPTLTPTPTATGSGGGSGYLFPTGENIFFTEPDGIYVSDGTHYRPILSLGTPLANDGELVSVGQIKLSSDSGYLAFECTIDTNAQDLCVGKWEFGQLTNVRRLTQTAAIYETLGSWKKTTPETYELLWLESNAADIHAATTITTLKSGLITQTASQFQTVSINPPTGHRITDAVWGTDGYLYYAVEGNPQASGYAGGIYRNDATTVWAASSTLVPAFTGTSLASSVIQFSLGEARSGVGVLYEAFAHYTDTLNAQTYGYRLGLAQPLSYTIEEVDEEPALTAMRDYEAAFSTGSEVIWTDGTGAVNNFKALSIANIIQQIQNILSVYLGELFGGGNMMMSMSSFTGDDDLPQVRAMDITEQEPSQPSGTATPNIERVELITTAQVILATFEPYIGTGTATQAVIPIVTPEQLRLNVVTNPNPLVDGQVSVVGQPAIFDVTSPYSDFIVTVIPAEFRNLGLLPYSGLPAPVGMVAPGAIPGDGISLNFSVVTLDSYNIVVSGEWTLQELKALLRGVVNTGEALRLQYDGINGISGVHTFHRVFYTKPSDTRTTIKFVRAEITNANVAGCNTDNNGDSTAIAIVTCKGSTLQFTEYTAVHELGHVFTGRMGGTETEGDTYFAMIEQPPPDTVLLDYHTEDGTPDPARVMGSVNNSDWERGGRGWGSPVSSSTTPCNFQQNAYSIVDVPTPNATQQALQVTEQDEAGADMFLNWVYSKIGQGGFANWDWRGITDCNATPPPDPDRAGDARSNLMNSIILPTLAARIPVPSATPTAVP